MSSQSGSREALSFEQKSLSSLNAELKHGVACPGAETLDASRTEKLLQMSLKLLLQVCGRGLSGGYPRGKRQPLQTGGAPTVQQQGDCLRLWGCRDTSPLPPRATWAYSSDYLGNIFCACMVFLSFF